MYRSYGVLDEQLRASGEESVLGGAKMSSVDLHFEPWVRQYGFAGLTLDACRKVKARLEWVGGLREVQKAYRSVKEANRARGEVIVQREVEVVAFRPQA